MMFSLNNSINEGSEMAISTLISNFGLFSLAEFDTSGSEYITENTNMPTPVLNFFYFSGAAKGAPSLGREIKL
jgi:hypothetical protein